MNVRMPLRWKILLFTLPPLLALTFGTVWLINRSVSDQVDRSVRADLARASVVFKTMYAARTRELAVAGQVIVQDPRFFSVLTLPGGAGDAQVQATVHGVASEFHEITGTDVFEVVDTKNRTLATVGIEEVDGATRQDLVREALRGGPLTGVARDPKRHFLVSATPVRAAGRIVGVLLLGDRIGQPLASKLSTLTRSEVTFICDRTITGSTLAGSAARAIASAAVDWYEAQAARAGHREPVFAVADQGHTNLTIVAPLPGSIPGSGQYYIIQRSLDAETAALVRMRRAVLGLGILAALVALLSGLFLAERVTSPLQRLVQGAVEMERDNYEYELPTGGRDEVGYLTERFLEMRQKQRDHVKSLEDLARVKSDFISVASHELRTPISIISCYHELMAHGQLGPISLEQKKALGAIGDSVTRLSSIAEHATVMAGIESARLVLEFDEHPIAILVGRAVESAKAMAVARSLRIEAVVEDDVALVSVDGSRLALAILQLVANAIRFTPDGGSVTVRGGLRGPELVIAVEDTGVGIPADQRKRIFDRAVTLGESMHHHSSGQLDFNSAGLGLGLSLALGIVEAHGGTIDVESEVGRGSRFTIRIPAGARALETAA